MFHSTWICVSYTGYFRLDKISNVSPHSVRFLTFHFLTCTLAYSKRKQNNERKRIGNPFAQSKRIDWIEWSVFNSVDFLNKLMTNERISKANPQKMAPKIWIKSNWLLFKASLCTHKSCITKVIRVFLSRRRVSSAAKSLEWRLKRSISL